MMIDPSNVLETVKSKKYWLGNHIIGFIRILDCLDLRPKYLNLIDHQQGLPWPWPSERQSDLPFWTSLQPNLATLHREIWPSIQEHVLRQFHGPTLLPVSLLLQKL